VLLLAAAVPALAQTSALRNHDTNAPILFDADRTELRDKDGIYDLAGSVRIRQGDLTLESDKVSVRYTQSKAGDLQAQTMDARGNVRLTSPSERATAKSGIYDVKGKLITLIGNVVLTQGQNQLSGQRLVIDLASGRSALDGRSSGAAGAAPATGGGRVSGKFVVPERGGSK
jgi:lipopolysaccharide export system protein LptA